MRLSLVAGLLFFKNNDKLIFQFDLRNFEFVTWPIIWKILKLLRCCWTGHRTINVAQDLSSTHATTTFPLLFDQNEFDQNKFDQIEMIKF